MEPPERQRRVLSQQCVKFRPSGLLCVPLHLLLLIFRAQASPDHNAVVACIPFLPRLGYAAELGAAVLALEDVAAGNCELIGSASCEALSDLQSLRSTFVEIASTSAEDVAAAAGQCLEEDADIIIGPVGVPRKVAAAFTGSSSGTPIVSHTSAVHGSANTGHSAATMAVAAAQVLTKLGAKQVAVIADSCGDFDLVSYMEALGGESITSGVSFLPASFCSESRNPRDSLVAALKLVQRMEVEAMLLYGIAAGAYAVTEAAEDAEINLADFVVFYGGPTPVQAFFQLPMESSIKIKETGETSLSCMRGMLGMQLSQMPLGAALQMEISESFNASGILLPGTNESSGVTISVDEVLDGGPLEPRVLSMYDAVWSAALASAISSATDDADAQRAAGKRVIDTLLDADSFPPFSGVSGRVGFAADGRRSASDAAVEVLSVVRSLPGRNLLTEVATWTESSGCVLSPNTTITWADGSAYPDLPRAAVQEAAALTARAGAAPGCDNDFSKPTAMFLGGIIGLAVGIGACFAALALVALYRKQQLQQQQQKQQKRTNSNRGRKSHISDRRISIFQGPRRRSSVAPVGGNDLAGGGSLRVDILDLESPIVKMLDFLRRYEAGGWNKPAKTEAKHLKEMIETADDLMSPNLSNQLSVMRPYSNGVTDFLLSTTSIKPPSSDKNKLFRPSGEMKRVNSAVTMLYENDTEDSRPLLDVAYDDPIKDPATASAYLVQSVKEVRVPDSVMHGIGTDFNLDFVSPAAPMRLCKDSLTVVLKQSLKALEIGHIMKSKGSLLRLFSFAKRIEDGYLTGGYHCRAHAADVTNRLACVMLHSGISQAANHSMTQCSQLLATLVSACIHDFEHPQVSNGFLVATEQPMAVAFNNQAVAENHCLRTSLALMRQEEYDFLATWKDKEAVKDLRQAMIQIVLSTDLARHFELLVQFKTKILNGETTKGKQGGDVWEAMDFNHRLLVLQVAMKVADLGHCMIATAQHIQWVTALQEEMFAQGDRERDLDMQISPMMDRRCPGVLNPNSQVGFFEVIIMPLIETWVEVFPGCKPLLTQSQENLQYWRDEQEILARAEEAKDKFNPRRISSRRRSSYVQKVLI